MVAPESDRDYVLSIIAISKDARHFQLIGEIEQWLNSYKCELLTRRRTSTSAVADVHVPSTFINKFESHISESKKLWFNDHGCDVNICSLEWVNKLKDGKARSNGDKYLFAFDLDSTLIQIECIDELARLHGVLEKVKNVTEKAMKGEINFKESFLERVALLKGLNAKDAFNILKKDLKITPGAEVLFRQLKDLGVQTAIISGGFLEIAEKVGSILGINNIYAHNLPVDHENLVTGEFEMNNIIDGEAKRIILLDLAKSLSIPPENIIAIGDGANDIPMLMAAGQSVAFCAKDALKEKSKLHLNQKDLSLLLDMIGLEDLF